MHNATTRPLLLEVGLRSSKQRERKSGAGSTRDIRLEQVDLTVGSKLLLDNADIAVIYGRRYGFVGRNGLGKTTLLKMIGNGQLKMPADTTVLHVEQEVSADIL